MRLSVIVPIYNVETTLHRCVSSILAQGVEGIEIILVDDGSTDGSALIAEKLADENKSIRLVRQRNKGLSAARNIGLLSSLGDYITFVDSDDWLLERTYSPQLDFLILHPECDILEYSVIRTGDDGTLDDITLPDAVYQTARSYWIDGNAFRHAYACNKIFRRSVFFPSNTEPELFAVGRVFEDVDIMSRLLQRNPVVITSSHAGYVYTTNPNGITATANGTGLRNLLESNLYIARRLGLRFAMPGDKNHWVDEEEVPFYLYLLNIQISVCQMLGSTPVLPPKRVRLRHVHGLTMILKVIMLNILGRRAMSFCLINPFLIIKKKLSFLPETWRTLKKTGKLTYH